MRKQQTADKSNKPHTNKWMFSLYVGFFAGVIWGGLKIIEFYFNLTRLTIGYMVEPFFKHTFLLTGLGYLIGWTAFIVFSIVAAFLYTAVLGKWKGYWPGIIYGVVWWLLIYMVIGPIAGMMDWIGVIEWNTLMTDLCLFVLWGMFIGYSIALEFTDDRIREPFGKNAKS